MNNILAIGATGLQTQQQQIDTIANNLVNLTTEGFKPARVQFHDLVHQGLGQAATAEPGQAGALTQGNGVGIAALSKIFTQGELKKTEGPLDVSIRGNGFLEVVMADGTPAVTRGGKLRVNQDGLLTDANGNALKPTIHVGLDMKDIAIQADGRVMVKTGTHTAAVEAGRIELANFNDPSGLTALGQNLYQASARSGDAVYGSPGVEGFGAIAQGFIEASSVNMIDEITQLMAAQRSYQMSAKVIQAADEIAKHTNDLRR